MQVKNKQKCQLCKTSLTYHRETSDLIKHFKHVHKKYNLESDGSKKTALHCYYDTKWLSLVTNLLVPNNKWNFRKIDHKAYYICNCWQFWDTLANQSAQMTQRCTRNASLHIASVKKKT